MGTAGRSGAPTGRGTHSRSELPHPTSPHLATSNFQQLLKKAKILHFLAGFRRLRQAGRPGTPPAGSWVRRGVDFQLRSLIAQ